MAGPWENYATPAPASVPAVGPWTNYEGGNDKTTAAPAEDVPKSFSEGFGSNMNASASGVANGIPIIGPAFNEGLNKVEAGIRTLWDGNKSYQDELASVRGQEQTDIAANPVTHTAAEIAGGVLGTAPLVAAAPAAFGAGAASLPVRIAAGVASGAAIGSADGGVRNGPSGAITGGLLGGALGAAGPVAGDVAGAVFRSGASRASQNEAARLAGTSRPAVDVVARALASDNAIGATNANIAAAGPGAMLADAGPSTLSTLDTAIQRGGPGAGQASQRIAARAGQATTDINAALDAGLGPDQGMLAPLTTLRDSTQPARKAAYDAAYGAPIDYADPRGQALEKMIKTRVPQAAITRANDLMRVNGEESKQILAKLADDGTVTYEKLPDVRQIDYITRGLRDVAAEADGKGKLGGTTDIGRAYGNLAGSLRDLTGTLVPEYKNALNTAAEPIRQREAMLYGQKMLSPGTTRDEVSDFVTGLSQPELQSLRGGIRAKFAETLSNVKRTVADPNIDAREGITALKDLSSDAARQKLTTVMGQQEADAMFGAVDRAAKAFELRAGVTTNSKTYARQAAERAVEKTTGPGVIDNVAGGKPLASAQGFMQNLLGAGKQAQLGRQDEAWHNIADLLTQPANQAGGTFLQALQSAAGALPAIDRNAARVSGAVTRGLASSSLPSERLLRTSRQ
ncbi:MULTISPECIES: hypothetical protein [unclassified Rhizobium]|uniref:hypothetical protein n=1 Tax=unclassified Rhizobium TaxID=2613769 RepID=UPI001AD974D2|nr:MULTISPECIES: hypothetical protein [unclassified Rhizobium]MBO9099440.1 hypothetical protein [Rhizobium sp. L58/93]QXZ87074.1 hypothetical protein J5287_21035 [Rhizobium sp. K1/93]QXZ92892.1 hypothetical protein J5280_19860 [Rhizobium sp. K15/93]